MKSIIEIYFFLYLAPIKLSEKLEELAQERKKIAFYFFKLFLPQIIPISLITILLYYNLTTNSFFIFFTGEIGGIVIILMTPIAFIGAVKGRDHTDIRESFLRGTSRVLLLGSIGGFLCLIMTGKWNPLNWQHIIFAVLTGYFTSNALTLMNVMREIDRLETRKDNKEIKQDILIASMQDERTNFSLYILLIIPFLILNYLYLRVGLVDNIHIHPIIVNLLFLKTIPTILIFTFLGMALGAKLSIGWIIAHILHIFSPSFVLPYDELGRLGHNKIVKLLHEIEKKEGIKAYYNSLSYFLSSSPFVKEIEDDFIKWIKKSETISKITALLDISIDNSKIIVTHFNSGIMQDKEQKLISTIRLLHATLKDDFISFQRHIRERRYNPEDYIEPIKKWIDLLPERFSSKEQWKTKFNSIKNNMTVNHDNDTLRNLIEINFIKFLAKDADEYFLNINIASLKIDWKQTVYYLKDGYSNIEIDIINTSSKHSAVINNIDISFSSKSIELTSDFNVKQLQSFNLDMPRYTIKLPLFCKIDKLDFKISVTIDYSASLLVRGEKKGRIYKEKFEKDFLLLKELPFEKIKNPYTRYPIRTKDALFGRDKLINQLIDTINKEPSPGYVLIQGERRMGKTSVLYVLEEQLDKLNIETIFFDSQSLYSDGENNNIILMKRLIEEYAEKYEKEVVIPKNEREFIDFFDKKRIVFLIDEFDAYLGRLTKKDLPFWNSRPFSNNNLSIVFSAPISKLRTQPIDMINILLGENSFSIKPLTSYHVRELIEKPVGSKLHYEPGAVTELIELTGGFPIYVQASCSELVNFMNEKKSNIVTKIFLKECLDQIDIDIPLLMASYIQLLDKDEIYILKLLNEKNNYLKHNEIIDLNLIKVIKKMEERDLINRHSDHISSVSKFLLDKQLLSMGRQNE